MEKIIHKIRIKITFTILLITTLLCLIFGFQKKEESEWHFAIIPHFMLDSGKVDQFYGFIRDKYYNGWWPNKIILISPNHFHNETNEIQTICESMDVNYKSEKINLSSELNNLWIKCDKEGKIFNLWWDNFRADEHGIWEHFQWINKYFPDSKVIPIISPCFQMSAIKDILPLIENLNWNILVIASVDFTHYLWEQETLQHDEKSIETLKSMTLNEADFINWIDADCPTCLYLLQCLATKQNQSAKLWWRDSSSTILDKDMKEENTSRLFMRYE